MLKNAAQRFMTVKMVAEAGILVMIVTRFDTIGALGITYVFMSLRLCTK